MSIAQPDAQLTRSAGHGASRDRTKQQWRMTDVDKSNRTHKFLFTFSVYIKHFYYVTIERSIKFIHRGCITIARYRFSNEIQAPHTMADSIIIYCAVRLDACVIHSLGSVRIVRSSELVVRCVEWVSHVGESLNKGRSNLTNCAKYN